jgi:hypothetical protein
MCKERPLNSSEERTNKKPRPKQTGRPPGQTYAVSGLLFG